MDREDAIALDRQAAAEASRARVELETTGRHLAGIRAAMIEELIRTPAEHPAKRDRLITGVQIIDALKKSLENAVSAGDVANYRLALAEQDLFRP